jgi:phosphopantothenoylcysteine decarboxylase/phosphopantothenate--cysteine ligase
MNTKQFWANKKVLVTAGPTKEYLDPVRFITNESSGKMGYAIAEELEQIGADVILVSGPIHLSHNFSLDKIIHINTAIEMYNVCESYFDKIDVAIFAAAVADYRPKVVADQKIKKQGEELEIIFIKNPDIALEFGKIKKECQFSIGFALETNDLLAFGSEKLMKKKFDLIVLNSPLPNQGFGFDTNKITILDKKKQVFYFPIKSKKEVANDILFQIQKIAE